jgi:hypothetical protein
MSFRNPSQNSSTDQNTGYSTYMEVYICCAVCFVTIYIVLGKSWDCMKCTHIVESTTKTLPKLQDLQVLLYQHDTWSNRYITCVNDNLQKWLCIQLERVLRVAWRRHLLCHTLGANKPRGCVHVLAQHHTPPTADYFYPPLSSSVEYYSETFCIHQRQ